MTRFLKTVGGGGISLSGNKAFFGGFTTAYDKGSRTTRSVHKLRLLAVREVNSEPCGSRGLRLSRSAVLLRRLHLASQKPVANQSFYSREGRIGTPLTDLFCEAGQPSEARQPKAARALRIGVYDSQ